MKKVFFSKEGKMTQQQGYKTKKDVLKSIEALAELDSVDFKKGVVDMLELLYEQDVSMTNLITARVESLEKNLDILKGYVLGLHVSMLKCEDSDCLTEDTLKDLSKIYDMDSQMVHKFVEGCFQLEVFNKIKKNFLFPKG